MQRGIRPRLPSPSASTPYPQYPLQSRESALATELNNFRLERTLLELPNGSQRVAVAA